MTNIAGYLWTVNTCDGAVSLYKFITDILRYHQLEKYSKYSNYLTSLYYCIITSKAVNQSEHGRVLWRGERRLFTPRMIGLPQSASGKVKWQDITEKIGNKDTLRGEYSKTGYDGVFQGFTALTPDISLAGYFCTSNNYQDIEDDVDYIQVMYELVGMKGEYSGWLYELQAFKEKENLCLPGLIYTVSNIVYMDHDDAINYWRGVGPKSAGNGVNPHYLRRPLLLITLDITGISGYLPGLKPESRNEINNYLNNDIYELDPEYSDSTFYNNILLPTIIIINTIGLSMGDLRRRILSIAFSYGDQSGGYQSGGKTIKSVKNGIDGTLKLLVENINKIGEYIVKEVNGIKSGSKRKSKRSKRKSKRSKRKKRSRRGKYKKKKSKKSKSLKDLNYIH